MVDYSKWKDIEISDDEDDTHPNIDKHSLFKWRHEARLNRMKEFEDKKKQLQSNLTLVNKQFEEARKNEKEKPDESDLREKREKLEKKLESLKKEEDDLKKQERLMPWNVDTISSEGWSKTVVNKPQPRKDRTHLSEEEKEKFYLDFVKDNEKKVKHFGMLSRWDDCKTYLLEEPQLCCEEAANYLALWCLNLAIEGKNELMEHVSKQVISLQYILELGKQLDCNPRSCISSFFSRIQTADKDYIDAYEDELRSFKKRIKDRAQEKIEKAMKEIEEDEKAKRLGPGGLDPAEVFETLPDKMKKCFEDRDIEALKTIIAEMDQNEANYHMKRCVASGLWIPDAKAAEQAKIEEETNAN